MFSKDLTESFTETILAGAGYAAKKPEY